jgi:hypothetical protein
MPLRHAAPHREVHTNHAAGVAHCVQCVGIGGDDATASPRNPFRVQFVRRPECPSVMACPEEAIRFVLRCTWTWYLVSEIVNTASTVPSGPKAN